MEPGPDGSEIADLEVPDLSGAANKPPPKAAISQATVASQLILARGFIGWTKLWKLKPGPLSI